MTVCPTPPIWWTQITNSSSHLIYSNKIAYKCRWHQWVVWAKTQAIIINILVIINNINSINSNIIIKVCSNINHSTILAIVSLIGITNPSKIMQLIALTALINTWINRTISSASQQFQVTHKSSYLILIKVTRTLSTCTIQLQSNILFLLWQILNWRNTMNKNLIVYLTIVLATILLLTRLISEHDEKNTLSYTEKNWVNN